MCNTNYLADMICPGCGFEEEFNITSLATAHVRDDEFFIEFSDFQWQRTDRCTCPECGFKGHVRDFVLASFCRAYNVQLKQPPAKVSAYPRAVRIILISNRDNCIFKLFRPAYTEGLMTIGEVFLDLVSAYQDTKGGTLRAYCLATGKEGLAAKCGLYAAKHKRRILERLFDAEALVKLENAVYGPQ